MRQSEGDDADVFGYHFENEMLAVNLFHVRGGRVLDRREFFWEDLPEFAPPADDAVRAPIGRPRLCPVSRKQPLGSNAVTTNFNPGEFFSALLDAVVPWPTLCPA